MSSDTTAFLSNVIQDTMTSLTNFLRCMCQKLWKLVGIDELIAVRT